jgi:CIC family chloride channel protein
LDMIRKDMFDANIPDDETIARIMVVPPAIIDYTQSVNAVMAKFDKLDVWQLPVVKDGRFIGFVSKSTLLAKYREELIKQHHQSDLFSNT